MKSAANTRADEFNAPYIPWKNLEEKQILALPPNIHLEDLSKYAYLVSREGKIIARRSLESFSPSDLNKLEKS